MPIMNATASVSSNASVLSAQSMEGVTPSQPSPHIFRGAYNATASDRIALAPSELLAVNLDVNAVTTMVLAALPRMWTLRHEIIASLPTIDVEQFDKIEIYAKALTYAQIVYANSWTPTEELPALAARALTIRAQFLKDASSLAGRGFLNAKHLEELKGGTGYENVAFDLGRLVQMFRERWNEIATMTPIRPTELDEAEHLFERIKLACAERARQSEATIAAAADRQRAYTLLVKAYDEARRATIFLRWHQDDADTFTPSLWAGRGGRGGGSSEGEKEEDKGEAPAPAKSAPVLVAPAAEPSTAGLPGASPFVNG